MASSGLAAIAIIALAGKDPVDAQSQGLIPVDQLVEITVNEFRPYTLAHTITITAGDPVFARTDAELEARSWSATRVSERGTETVNSGDCPALRTVALSFSSLPLVLIRPMSAISWGGVPGEGVPMPPTMKDGFSTSLRFRTVGEDNSPVTIELTGAGAYQRWGHDSVTALLGCWGGLVP